MGSVTQLHDNEDDRLLARARNVGEEGMSEGERWRLANVRDRQRQREASAALQGQRTDALSSQANERRFLAIEKRMALADWMLREGVGEVIGESLGEERQHAAKLVDELRVEIGQKLDASLGGFEQAIRELRGEDRTALLETVRQTLSDAESRIDEHLEKALQSTWERCELEIAMVRDEILNLFAEKRYGSQLVDDVDPKLAERAIGQLRQRMDAVEEKEGQRAQMADRLGGAIERLANFESEVRKGMRSLLVRCGVNVVGLRKEAKRADELAGKVERLEATQEKLIATLLERRVID